MGKKVRRIPLRHLAADPQRLAEAAESNFIAFAKQIEFLTIQMQQALGLNPGGTSPGVQGLDPEESLPIHVEHFDEVREDGATVPYGRFGNAVAAEAGATNAITNGNFSGGFTGWTTTGATTATAKTGAPIYDSYAEVEGYINQSFTYTGTYSVGLYVYVGIGATVNVYLGGTLEETYTHNGDWRYVCIPDKVAAGATEVRLESTGASSYFTAVMVVQGKAYAGSFTATSRAASDIQFSPAMFSNDGFTLAFRFWPYGATSGTLVEIQSVTDTITLTYDEEGVYLNIVGGSTVTLELGVSLMPLQWHFIAFSIRSDGWVLLGVDQYTRTGKLTPIETLDFTGKTWRFGRDEAGPNHAEGLLDELRVEQRVVSPAVFRTWNRMNQPFDEPSTRADVFNSGNDHGRLAGLLDYDHTNLVHRTTNQSNSAKHTWSAGAAFGTSPDYCDFDAAGNFQMYGAATVFDDVVISGVLVKTGATPPSWDTFKGNVKLYAFTDNSGADESVHFTIQLPHGIKVGASVEFHVHLAPNANASAPNNVARFILEYTSANIDGTFGNTETATADLTVGAADALKNKLLTFGNLTITDPNISCCLVCMLKRATNSDAADTYANKVFLVSADAHVEKDTIGSKTVSAK